MSSSPIYLDWAASTPIDEAVAAAMRPFLDQPTALALCGNPLAAHTAGRAAAATVARARQQVGSCLEVDDGAELIFTGCASEGSNLALKGAVFAELARRGNGAAMRATGPPPKVVAATIEHPATVKALQWLERMGFAQVAWVGVSAMGVIDVAAIERELDDNTLLVTVMHSNNEVGALQPVAEIARVCHQRTPRVLVHCDASQSVGKVAVSVRALDVDMMTIAAHKFYGPKGVGALYVRKGTPVEPLVHGAPQEGGMRAGTESTVLIAGLGAACELAAARLAAGESAHLDALRERLRVGLERELSPRGAVVTHGPTAAAERLPNVLSISLPGVVAGRLIGPLGERVCASSGSACKSGQVSVSSVLAAMGVAESVALGTFRFSVGHATTEADIDAAIAIVAEMVKNPPSCSAAAGAQLQQ